MYVVYSNVCIFVDFFVYLQILSKIVMVINILINYFYIPIVINMLSQLNNVCNIFYLWV